MLSRAATLLAACLICGPAFAAGSIGCESVDGAARIDLTIGSLPVLKIVGASIEADGEMWSLSGEGQLISVGQAFGDEERVLVDFTDENVERIVASLRLFKASAERDAVTAGTLSVPDQGVYAVSCVGP